MINRRELLNIAATAGVASVLAAKPAHSAERETPEIEIIDTNVPRDEEPWLNRALGFGTITTEVPLRDGDLWLIAMDDDIEKLAVYHIAEFKIATMKDFKENWDEMKGLVPTK